MRIHANDGIAKDAEDALVAKGFKVTTNHVEKDRLVDFINNEKVDALLVRSATKVRKDTIDACPGLKFIGRGGVGMDNIDVAYAREKGLTVSNTPSASCISVAEMVMGHLFSLSRGLYKANRRMPAEGADSANFKAMKKEYGQQGIELRGKTLGVLGFGRIGHWVARYGLGAGMNVIYRDHHATEESIDVQLGGKTFQAPIKPVQQEELLTTSDFLAVHVSYKGEGNHAIGEKELAKMKRGVIIVNTARGSSIDEKALMAALKSGHVAGAGLDVFQGEPSPDPELLAMPNVSLSPHIGAATKEAQQRIGEELVELLVAFRDQVSVAR